MRRLIVLILSALVVLALPGIASAHPTGALQPTLPTDVTFAATDNIDYLGRFPEHIGNAGGMRVGDRYYASDPRGIFVYDVAGEKASAPVLLGSMVRFQTTTGAALAQEDVNTDGNIMILDGSANPFTGAAFSVIDVSDPANMSVLSTVPGRTDHTWTCVSGVLDTGEVGGCAYAFGRSGYVIDLTDPSNAKEIPVTWRAQVGYGNSGNSPYTHDLTEVKPGLVMSAGADSILMDTSALLTSQYTDVLASGTAPVRKIATIGQRSRFPSLGFHSVEWAVQDDGSLDPFVIIGTEIAPSGATNAAGSDCNSPDAVVETWDARGVIAAINAYTSGEMSFEQATAGAAFTKIDAFDAAGRGAYVDGKAPAHVLYCAHWMELHPDFDAGGMVAISFYDRGTRFVSVNDDGTFAEEAGWIVPFQGYSGSVQWVTGDTLYIHDYTRGMEVIRFSGEAATGAYENASSPQALTSSFSPAASFNDDGVAPAAILLLGFATLVLEIRRRRSAGVQGI